MCRHMLHAILNPFHLTDIDLCTFEEFVEVAGPVGASQPELALGGAHASMNIITRFVPTLYILRWAVRM